MAMEAPQKVSPKTNLLLLSPWKDDWDLNSIRGNPENAYLFSGLAQNGYRVHLILPWDRQPITQRPPDIFFHPVKPLTVFHPKRLKIIGWLFDYVFVNIQMIIAGLRLARTVDYRLVYGISAFMAPAAFFLGRLTKKPTINKILGVATMVPVKRFSLHYLLINLDALVAFMLPCDRLIVIDDGSQGNRAALHFRIPPHRFQCWVNPVNSNWLRRPRRTKLRQSAAPKNEKILLTAARLIPYKRTDQAIRALALVVKEYPRVKLLIAGEGPQRPELELLARRLGLTDRITFLGNVAHDQMVDYYKISDLFLSPNIVTTITLTVAEAMISGLPIVAVDVRDAGKAIRNGYNGFLVPPDDPQALSSRVLTILKNPKLQRTLGSNSQKFARRYFPTWPDRIKSELEVITELCG